MVALKFWGTEIFYSSKRLHENKGDQEFKYTESTLGWTLGTCIARSLHRLHLQNSPKS